MKNKKSECTGCGACIVACTHNAISFKHTSLYTWLPNVDKSLCVECGLCDKVCETPNILQHATKKAYIAYNTDSTMRYKSASGGVFSAFATYIIKNNGIVYGASLRFDDGKAIVEHVRVNNTDDLHLILGSKYVQSDCVKAYKQIKQDLKDGKTVLFGGCSCQVAGLKNYLRTTDQSNLYTIDLICHGVPTLNFFNRYVSYLQNKYRDNIKHLTFRTKDLKEDNGIILYQIAMQFDRGNKIVVPIRDSGYYRMFIGEESYRDACYHCEYASLDKPADITTGDYFEAKKDYPELFKGKNAINTKGGISCLIVHSEKGRKLLKATSNHIFLHGVDPKIVQASHGNLHSPSKYSALRYILSISTAIFGYNSIEKYYRLRNRLVDLIKRR